MTVRHLIFWKYWQPAQYWTEARGSTVVHHMTPGYWVHRWDIPWSYMLLGIGLFVMAASFIVLQLANYIETVRPK